VRLIARLKTFTSSTTTFRVNEIKIMKKKVSEYSRGVGVGTGIAEMLYYSSHVCMSVYPSALHLHRVMTVS
jgi:hypothetical protein